MTKYNLIRGLLQAFSLLKITRITYQVPYY